MIMDYKLFVKTSVQVVGFFRTDRKLHLGLQLIHKLDKLCL
jgi:hypothetical protein